MLFDTPYEGTEAQDEGVSGSLSQQAYQRLRDMIVTLRLAPGALVNEAALMDELDLGRTPIREALQRLAYEGLVVMQPRRGAFVGSLSIVDLQQIFELRRTIEGYAASLAAERATPADVVAMQTALGALDSTGTDASPETYIAIDRSFHRAVARAAHNRFLEVDPEPHVQSQPALVVFGAG